MQAVDNYLLTKRFKDEALQLHKDAALWGTLSEEVRLELYALFSQANFGDARSKDFSKVPEHLREWAWQ